MRKFTSTLFVGLLIILVFECLLFLDCRLENRRAIETQVAMDALATPGSFDGEVARFVAINMTPLAWLGFVIFLDGVLVLQTGSSPLRARSHHFAFCALASIPVWCSFDVINFYFFKPPAWTYIGVPLGWPVRFLGYAIAFAAELPGMFLSAQVFMDWRWFEGWRSRSWRLPLVGRWIISLLGLFLLLWAILGGNSVANYGLWCSFVFLLDPINLTLGRPSILGDWQSGWYGRSIALGLGGLLCGFLWEFWNYWALEKWIYHLPFLGGVEQIRYFQMPLPGLLGFIPFGMATWVMWQTIRIPLDGLVEPLPNERTII
jgi:hypothetical protein